MAKTKRFLAMLLAVLMLVSLMPTVLADGAVPELRDSGEAYVPANATPEEVNHILSKALIANYDEVGDQEWEYECEGTFGFLKNTAFVSIAGGTSTNKRVKYTHPALADNNDGTYKVRIAGTTTVVSFNKDRFTPVINVADDISMNVVVNDDGSFDTAAMEAEFLKNYVTVVEPADAQVSVSLNIAKRTATVSYAGSEQYKDFSATVDVNYIDNRSEVAVAQPDENGVYSAGIKYNPDMSWDYDAVRQNIIDAVLVDSGLTPENVDVTFYASTPSGWQHAYVPLEGKDVSIVEKYPALTDEGVSTFRLAFAGNKDVKGFTYEVKVDLQDGRIQTVIVLNEGVSIVYNKDASVMKNNIFANLINWNETVLPEGITVDDLSIEYYATATAATGSEELWYDIAGGEYYKAIDLAKLNPYTVKQLGAGEAQQIRISYAGTYEYKSTASEGTLTVEKAPVKVIVHSTSIFPDQDIPEGFVTTDPEDDFAIWTIYAGVASNVTTIVYVQLPDGMLNEDVMKVIDPIYAKTHDGQTLTERLQEGMTVGELRELIQELAGIAEDVSKLPGMTTILEKAGLNVQALNAILEVLQNLPGILDDVTVAIGTPNRAGVYMVTAIATNENYKTGTGVGMLLVKMRMIGVSLAWAQTFDGSLTVSEAAAADFSAVVMYNGEAVKNPGTVKYLYTGISNGRLYSSREVPTQPGKYIVTASVSGGNYLAVPITRTFTIVADPAPEVSPEA